MGTCCSKSTDHHSHLDLCDTQEEVDIRRELQKIKEEVTNPALTDQSFSSDKEFKHFANNDDNEIQMFCEEIIKEFNCARTNPKSYLKKLGYFEQFIKYTNSSIALDYENHKYRLSSSNAFEELNALLDSITDHSQLELRQELQISIPEGLSMIKNYDYIANQFVMKKLMLANKYTYFSFHLSRGTLNAQLSSFLQLLDDSSRNRQRRNNILNENFSSIGVSVAQLKEDDFLCYFVFAG